MFFNKMPEFLRRLFLVFGLTRQETYVVILLAVLSVVGASIPYVKVYFQEPNDPAPGEQRSDAFRYFSDRVLHDSSLTRNEKDSLMAIIGGDSSLILRWEQQADSLEKLLTEKVPRETLDSFFLQVRDAPVRQININDATASELSGLPGVGEKIAERIVEYRNKNGSFRSVDDLQNIKGIGKKMFAKIKPFVEI